MKIYPSKFNLTLFIGVAMITAIFITRPAHSQERAKRESHKSVIIKISSDDNGKTTVIDTLMEFPDSAIDDSIQKMVEKYIVIGRNGKHNCFRFDKSPHGFNYDFEIPEWGSPKNLDELEKAEWEEVFPAEDEVENVLEEMVPESHAGIVRSGEHRQTLNDVLGDIPMDRVKNYSIKNTKNGKRIVIEMENGPSYEKDRNVVIIREPGRRVHRPHSSQYRMKVIRHSDAETKQEKVEDVPEVPSPPPPPPPDTKEGKSHSEAPKI